jgi:hypothetical protein
MQMTFREHLLRDIQWLTRTTELYLHDLPPGTQEEAVREGLFSSKPAIMLAVEFFH